MVSVDGLTKDEKMVLLSMTNGFMSLGNFPVGLLEIRRMTGMSTTALAQALRKLIRKGVVERTSCNRYKLTDKEKQLLLIALGPFFNDYLLEKAERVSKEISRFKTVEGVFLLGSLAQGRGSYDSDIDLLIILGHQNESLERRISNVISKLSLQLGVPVEPSFLSVKGARDHQRIQASPELRPQGGLPLFERSHKLHQREKKRSKGWGDKLLGGEKIAVFLRVAEGHLKDAESALGRGTFHDCVYHSASAAENAADALIIWLGGAVPHMHRDSETLKYIAHRLRPELFKDGNFKLTVKNTKELERHVVKSKYPVEVRDGVFLSPEEFYKKHDAKRMFNKAQSVVKTAKRFLRT